MKWSKRQIKAMKGSVKKWERIVAGTGVDGGGDNCPCCAAYYGGIFTYINCVKCPINIVTGASNCVNTGYGKYCNDETQENAEAMLADMYYIESVVTDDDWIKR